MGSARKGRRSDCTWVTYVARQRVSTPESDLGRGEENLLATTVGMDQDISATNVSIQSAILQ